MNKRGPIIIIDADSHMQDLFQTAFLKLDYPNKLIFCFDGLEALELLNRSDIIPFLILSDAHIPKLDGFALRDKIKIDQKLQLRCTPYIFFSTTVTTDEAIASYGKAGQGFFLKTTDSKEIEKCVTLIMDYWTRCVAPDNFLNYSTHAIK